MGQDLQKALSDNYRAIGFITFEGKYTALSFDSNQLGVFDLQTPPIEAMESKVGDLGMQNALLDFSDKNKLPEFLHHPVLSRFLSGIGAQEVPLDHQFNPPEYYSDYIAYKYDGLIYIKTTSASQLFPLAAKVPGYLEVAESDREKEWFPVVMRA